MDDNAQYTQVAVNIQDLTPPNKGPKWRLLQLRRNNDDLLGFPRYDEYRIVDVNWCL
jgi:hypothetical protein